MKNLTTSLFALSLFVATSAYADVDADKTTVSCQLDGTLRFNISKTECSKGAQYALGYDLSKLQDAQPGVSGAQQTDQIHIVCHTDTSTRTITVTCKAANESTK